MDNILNSNIVMTTDEFIKKSQNKLAPNSNKWIIKDFIPLGLTIIESSIKSGKSNLLSNILLSLNGYINQTKLLGYDIENNKNNILYLSTKHELDNMHDFMEKNNVFKNGENINKFYEKEVPIVKSIKESNNAIEEIMIIISEFKQKHNDLKVIAIDTNIFSYPFPPSSILNKINRFALKNELSIIITKYSNNIVSNNYKNKIDNAIFENSLSCLIHIVDNRETNFKRYINLIGVNISYKKIPYYTDENTNLISLKPKEKEMEENNFSSLYMTSSFK